MAKQSSLFSFFTKSPPPVSKPKPSPSPTEADLPSSVDKSNSSPTEQAKQTAQQQPSKSSKSKAKSEAFSAKGGFKNLFGDTTPTAKERSVSRGSSIIAGTTFSFSFQSRLMERIATLPVLQTMHFMKKLNPRL